MYIRLILFIIVIIFTACMPDTANLIVSSPQKQFNKHSITKSNMFSLEGVSLRIPSTWSFTFESDKNSIVGFESPKDDIIGRLQLHAAYDNSNLETYFLNHLKGNKDIKYEWVQKYKKRLYAKGQFSKYEKYLQQTMHYTIYSSVFTIKGRLYELVVLGSSSEELSFEDKALFIINSAGEAAYSKNLVLQGNAVRVEVTPNWIVNSQLDKQIVNLRHKEKDAILTLSHKGPSSGGVITKDKTILNTIDTFRSHLNEIQLDYYYNIKTAFILGKKKSLLLEVFGSTAYKSVEIQRYYFGHRNNIYELSLWYKKKDKDYMLNELEEIMDKIKLE